MSRPAEAMRDALRFTICVFGTYAIAELLDLPLAYMTPVFLAALLQLPQPLPLRFSLLLLGFSFVAFFGGAYLFIALQGDPALSLAVQAGCLGVAFWYGARGGNGLFVLVALIALLLMPLLVQASGAGGARLALVVIAHLAAALLIGAVAWRLLPTARKPKPMPAPRLPAHRLGRVVALVVAVLPLLLWLQQGRADYPLLAVFVAVLLQKLTAISTEDAGRRVFYRHILRKGAELAAANALGGLAALLTYRILTLAPSWTLLLALAAAVIATCAALIWSGRSWGAFAGSACTAYVILIGGALAGLESNVDAQLANRFQQLGYAVVYVFVAVAIVVRIALALQAWRDSRSGSNG
ncbi:hypothetical protein PSA7680_00785 [Pseudoruegeria aquimaris]|uniref:DUF2955 domain-containing protein n=1 Tax=Pseudoruegeria aquimaris TaxID=393663 RepID=A0A1Y5RP57_9RHOB|nr:DUF2955 domain-containing protein [Pseudoruegeria aquimaris]SLN21047.1 hypothetical protein PSA7680_00785 [Pseudoruegeria aquimaris]